MFTIINGKSMAIIKTENLCKTYGSSETTVQALKNINIEIEKGDFVAVMGPSGSGKSTLLHLLGALENPTFGSITLQGRKYSSLSDRQLTNIRRFNIGFIFQFFNLLPILTVEENITMPLVITGKSTRKYTQKIEEILKMVGLEKRRRHFADQISGGEQQRAAIARALITEPAVLLADEPTGNLDSTNSLHILNLLKESSEKLNQTVTMVTHDVKAAAYANKVIFLKDGEIVARNDLTKVKDKSGQIMSLLAKLHM